ncbi:hypothetical protein D1007_07942 [Hordeum vulgare]|nr:hypothetical protein D1007_07942 [Hordeum vulgare]
MHAVVDTHRRFTKLSVVYTNNLVWVEHCIHIMELLLVEEKYKVVGFDLEYTQARFGSCPKVLKNSGIACENIVNIQGQYKIRGSKKHEKDSLVHLAEDIIDPYYRDMKNSCNKDKRVWHSSWMEKLNKAHVVYADKQAYMSYKMYKRIIGMRKRLFPKNGQGSPKQEVEK